MLVLTDRGSHHFAAHDAARTHAAHQALDGAARHSHAFALRWLTCFP